MRTPRKTAIAAAVTAAAIGPVLIFAGAADASNHRPATKWRTAVAKVRAAAKATPTPSPSPTVTPSPTPTVTPTPTPTSTPTAAGLPAQLFAPYFQTYRGTNLADASAASGAKWVTLAFVTTPTNGSCTVRWQDAGVDVADGIFTTSIGKIRAAGGDVIVSFGGGGAGIELANSCASVDDVAKEIERVITVYNLKRIDFDVEGDALKNLTGIDRRNQALAKVSDWAKANNRTLEIQYTLPTTTNGLLSSGLNVIKSAVKYNVPVTVVNTMTFDYYDGVATHDMAKDTQTALTGLHNQLAALYPAKTDAQLWAMEGATEMVGVDDAGPGETFTLDNANTVAAWAAGKHLGFLSFWALQRDNGSCPGSTNLTTLDACSGLTQNTWDYTKTFLPFTQP